jgi:hypothetical protein
MPKLRTLAPLVRTLDTRIARPPPRQIDPIYNVPRWSPMLVVGARPWTMGIGAARHSPSTACMPTTSSSFVMVANHLISTMANAFVPCTTKSKRLPPELVGLGAIDGGAIVDSKSVPATSARPVIGRFSARGGEISKNPVSTCGREWQCLYRNENLNGMRG